MALAPQLARARDFDPRRFLPWRVGSETVGWVTADFARTLLAYPEVFRDTGGGLELIPADPETRSTALDRIARPATPIDPGLPAPMARLMEPGLE